MGIGDARRKGLARDYCISVGFRGLCFWRSTMVGLGNKTGVRWESGGIGGFDAFEVIIFFSPGTDCSRRAAMYALLFGGRSFLSPTQTGRSKLSCPLEGTRRQARLSSPSHPALLGGWRGHITHASALLSQSVRVPHPVARSSSVSTTTYRCAVWRMRTRASLGRA